MAAQWDHRCAYCGKGDWENATRFNLDHVVPRSAGGADNVRNLVWSCQPCNQMKGERPVEAFLRENPERLTAVLRQRRIPLAAAGQHAAICKALTQRLKAAGLKTTEPTGADTAHTRNANAITKSHANDAACCDAQGPVTQLRQPLGLKSIGHGRWKQIKSLPAGPYLRWRHQTPSVRRATPCPGHAQRPNHAHRIRTGDIVQVLSKNRWIHGRAAVTTARDRISVRTKTRTMSTTKANRARKIAPKNGYRASESVNQT